MKSNKKRILFVLAILTMALVLSCAFVACDKVDTDKTGTDIAADYKVTIHPNNGQGDIVWDITKEIPTITKDGFHIAGYFLDAQLTMSTTLESLKATGLTNNIDIYVKWEEDVCEHVEVTDVAVAPTCTEKGLTEGTHCSKCGKILQAQNEIPALGHDFSKEWTIDKEATCTEKGSKSHHCTRCEVKSDETEIPTIEHSESDWIIDKEATCTEDGSKHTECTVCHTTIKTEKISALGHTGGTATCTEQATCSVCGEKYGDALGHNYGDIIPKTEPTCSQKGVEAHYKCSVCNKVFKDDEHKTETTLDELTIAINPNAHNFGEWIKNEGADTHTRVCSFNSEHTETESCHGGTATCTEQAICERCGNKYGESLGHAIVHHEAKAPTCTEIGWEAYDTCSRCDYTTYVEIPAGHNFDESGVCNACGYFETGLAFELNEDGESYSVVGIGTFSGTELKIPNVNFDTKPVTEIKSNAFYNCAGLTSVTIPASVTSIGDWAFSGCTGLTSVTIGGSVTSIGTGAFLGCTGLTSVTIPGSVTSIGGNAFNGCTGLTSITIPNSVTSIGYNAFNGCNKLQDIYITDIAAWCNISGLNNLMRYGASNKNLYINNKLATSITIPDSVTSIGNEAFSRCTGLTSVTIPVSVTSIGERAFYNCTGLTSITIPDSVTSIADYAFEGCTDLTSVTIPDSVTSIGSWAFYYTAWYNNQPDGLVYAGKVAYKYKGTMSSNTSIVLKEGTLGIAGSAFSDCTGLTSVTIPDSVTSIGSSAFYNCTGLTTVNWNATACTRAGSSIFNGCSNLATVNIGDNVKIIPSYAFRDCTGLTNITIPDSVTSIGSYVFDGTAWYNNQPDGLVYAGKVAYKYKGTMPSNTSIVLKEGTLGIAGSAFSDCTGLTSITIPDSVTSIGDWAFSDCTGLTSVTIGNGVTSIGEHAFYGCNGLTSIKFNGTIEQWNAISKGSYWKYNVPATQVGCTDGTISIE